MAELHGRRTPRCTARRSATRCGSATPTCGSRSNATSPSAARRSCSAAASPIRESMAQGVTTRADGALDTVITNAIVLDWWGIVRADVGIRDGRIVALGQAGNPDITDGVIDLLIGPSTDVISGEGRIVTAGAIDSHVHLLSPSQVHEALATGITTIVGGGTGPSEGSKATTVTPGSWHLRAMHRALDPLPVNVLLLARATRSAPTAWPSRHSPAPRATRCTRTGARHPPRSTRRCGPRTTGACRSPCTPTPSTRRASSSPRSRAIGGRSIHAFHVEGAGGGHAPDILSIAGLPHVIPGSTNPTLPHTVNTVAEHLDMLMVCHHLNPAVPEDLAFAESRIRATTIAAEDILHDIGALSVTSSDAQAMGRIGEVVTRTWQVAHVMKHRRGPLGGSLPADNERARRYVAKYTINPAIAHGDRLRRRLGRGRQAGRPHRVGPAVLRCPAGRRRQGRRDRLGRARRPERVDPDAAAGADAAVVRRHDRGRPVRHVRLAGRAGRRDRRPARPAPAAARGAAHARGRQGRHEEQRHAARRSDIDPDTFEIAIDGDPVEPAPAARLPLAQLYSMF